MKRFWRLALILAAALVMYAVGAGAAYAEWSEEPAEEPEWYYYKETYGNACTITGYAGTATELTIPTEIDGMAVTRISNGAFRGYTTLTSITIPDSVREIGSGAFRDCTSLLSVTIPTSIDIGEGAFSGCPEVVIYGKCGINLTWTFDVAGTLTISGIGQMYGWFESTWVGTRAPWDFIRSSIQTVVISNGVTEIGDFAFVGCTSLISVTIPNSVTSIQVAAFGGCTSLASVVIPESVTHIGEIAFSGCTSLTSITMPVSVANIDSEAFGNCTSLTNVYYDGTLTQWRRIALAPNMRTTEKCGILRPTQKEAAEDGTEE